MERCRGVIFALVCGIVLAVSGTAQVKLDPDAQTAYQMGLGYARNGNYLDALRMFNRAVTLDPENADACAHLVSAAKSITPSMEGWSPDAMIEARTILQTARDQYTLKASLNPKKAVYQWALGQFDQSATQESAERYYRSALAIDAGYARASLALASTLAYRGDSGAAREVLRKATELHPNDVEVLAAYAQSIDNSELDLRRKLFDSLRALSPEHPAGAEVLARLAVDEGSLAARIADLEQLKLVYPPDETNSTEWYMRFLFDAYNRSDPIKSLSLAEEMVKITPQGNAQKDWLDFARYAQTMAQARSLLDRKAYTDVLKLLNDIKPPYLVSLDPQTVLQAKAADLGGDTARAYQIVTRALALEPSDALLPVLTGYADKLKKTPAQVQQDIWTIQRKNSTSFPGFTLNAYRDNKPIRLSDYRGHVILVSFWDPESKDCRDQLPELQKMLSKYSARGLVAITINVRPERDAIARVISSHYSLVALRVPDPYWVSENYSLTALPTNFLIDRQGRAYFYGAFWGFDPRHSFESEVEALLSRK